MRAHPLTSSQHRNIARKLPAHPIDELLMEAKEFFVSKSFSELAKEQGVRPLENPAVRIGGWPADEDIDAFLEKTYKERSP